MNLLHTTKLTTKSTLENFIIDLIQKRKIDLLKLEEEKEDYSKQDYMILWNRYHGSINDLLIALTSFSNPLAQIKKEDKIFIPKNIVN